MHRQDGPAEGVGRFVVRLARALRLQSIVLIETSPTGGFSDDIQVRRCVVPNAYGEAIAAVDNLARELHQACARRLGRLTA